VIRGFEIAVQHLQIGTAATFFVPSDLAYGKVGQPPDILDDDDLVIEVEVLGARNVDLSSVEIMNDEQKFLKAEESKEQANEACWAQRYDEALALF